MLGLEKYSDYLQVRSHGADHAGESLLDHRQIHTFADLLADLPAARARQTGNAWYKHRG
jgi:hypothetical protein